MAGHRVRTKSLPDLTDRYAAGINKFRAAVSSSLARLTERIRGSGGNVFCDTGEIRSRNDEKHIFFAGSDYLDEAFTFATSLMKMANETGVTLRMVGVPTNLRGDYVYHNTGETSIDGDFKSHLHTIIQELKSSGVEEVLKEGESVFWVLENIAGRFTPKGSLQITNAGKPNNVQVNIRGFRISNSLVPFICRAI